MNQKFHFTTTLIIDDNEVDLLVNRRLMELTRFSENIIIANNAEQALQILKTESSLPHHIPDLIFLDIHLPGMSGYDFIEKFKKLPTHITQKTKIVMLTVFQKKKEIEKYLEHDFVLTHLEKPLTKESLKYIEVSLTEKEKVGK